jgi:Zn-dependent alcohol dehydrogenase
VAVDLVDEKLKLAKSLGATYTVNAKESDPIEEIKKLGGAEAHDNSITRIFPRLGETGTTRAIIDLLEKSAA